MKDLVTLDRKVKMKTHQITQTEWETEPENNKIPDYGIRDKLPAFDNWEFEKREDGVGH